MEVLGEPVVYIWGVWEIAENWNINDGQQKDCDVILRLHQPNKYPIQ